MKNINAANDVKKTAIRPGMQRFTVAGAAMAIMSPALCAMTFAAQGSRPVAQASCPIVPAPKEYQDRGGTIRLLAPAETAIVIGVKAREPEVFAAERLQTLINKRFGVKYPIAVEGKESTGAKQILLLGQRDTNAALDKLCRDKKINLDAKSPGADGFVIDVADDSGRQTVIIGGSNARGVIYGQEAFFDMLRRDGDKVVFPNVAVRDWASIPWRGRPSPGQCDIKGQLAEGVLDAYVRARINWTDIRAGNYGIKAGAKLDGELIRKVLAEAHRRGMFVYGTVSTGGVEPGQFDAVIGTYKELIDLGVDGLWLSFDDQGAGTNANILIEKILELGKSRNINGMAIAITPPAGAYGRISAPFNKATAAAVPGFDDVTWMFTIVPSAKTAEEIRQIGLKRLYAWWHNWPRTPGGFNHDTYRATSLMIEGKRSPVYHEIPPLSLTTVIPWGDARYEAIKDAAVNTDNVMMFDQVFFQLDEYLLGAWGIWAWDPAGHDWDKTRGAIYATVFGPAQVEKARAFDDKLIELKKLFCLPEIKGERRPSWLKDAGKRPDALKLIGELDEIQTLLQLKSPAETLMLQGRLEKNYLNPMKDTIAWARKMAILDYPEYAVTLKDVEKRMMDLANADKTDELEKAIAEVRPKVLPKLEGVEAALKDMDLNGYVKPWREALSDVEYWKKRIAAVKEAEAAQKRGKGLNLYLSGDCSRLLTAAAIPPQGTLLSETPATAWSAVKEGTRGQGWEVKPVQPASAAISIYRPEAKSAEGDIAEIGAEIPVPKFTGRLFMDVFVCDTYDRGTKDCRFMELKVNDRQLWQEDIQGSRSGKEWVSVDVTDQAKNGKLVLRFRVTDRKPLNDPTAVLIGAIRLRDAKP
ncbi:MAG: hypothetical protein HZA50_06555 [Planctomycetes bacterium]|nr:hypothetical protein [Planctomycetota bacterium]